MGRLGRRARKGARDDMKKRVSGGKSYRKMSIGMKKMIDQKFSTLEVKGLTFNPFLRKWKRSDNLSVNYIICSIKN